MSEPTQQIRCIVCGNVWLISFNELDRQYLVIHKSIEQLKEYSVPCPKCGTHNVLSVRVKE